MYMYNVYVGLYSISLFSLSLSVFVSVSPFPSLSLSLFLPSPPSLSLSQLSSILDDDNKSSLVTRYLSSEKSLSKSFDLYLQKVSFYNRRSQTHPL